MNIERARDILVRVRAEGHDYVIYENGEVEGFGDSAVIFNYFPQLKRRAIANSLLARKEDPSPVLIADD